MGVLGCATMLTGQLLPGQLLIDLLHQQLVARLFLVGVPDTVC